MTEKEYQNAFKELQEKFEFDKKALARKFAFEHNPVKIGDWVGDNGTFLRVESWGVTTRWQDGYPCLVYRGTTCKKNGEPRKNAKNDCVFQSNLLYINGKFIENHGYGEE